MSGKRLDELVATLASARPALDDAARARVATALNAPRSWRATAATQKATAAIQIESPRRLMPHPMRVTTISLPRTTATRVDPLLVKSEAGRDDSVTDLPSNVEDANGIQLPVHAAALDRTQPARAPKPNTNLADLPRVFRNRAVLIGGALAAMAVASVAIWQSQQEPAEAMSPAPRAALAPMHVPPPVPQPPREEAPLDYDALRRTAQNTLRASIRETEPAVRVQGADALGKSKDPLSVPALTELTEHDPDAEVRGHAADALGTIGAASAQALLAKLETTAPPPLKVWYASARARLGDKGAAKRLLGYARSKDLAVSFSAALTLADVSLPGDTQAIAALTALSPHELELDHIRPYAGALILTKLAALHYAGSRSVLYAILDNRDEGARLAAAEGLARLGDDAGKKALQDVLANQASPNRLAAAVALISLGDDSGLELITAKLDDKDPGIRRLAARALGDIAERKSLPKLAALANDNDGTVRVAAAAAIVAIVGLDPQVLAQASVGWTRSALDSQDPAVRKAAASVLDDIPGKEAVPLLAQAIADRDPSVRLAASNSAGRMRSADAVAELVLAMKAEANANIKEQQVKALGEIGYPEAHDTLAQLSEEPGRIGVIAAGSLIAVGDAAGKARLEAATAAPQADLRLAAMEAAATAKNPIVVPILKIGAADRVFGVRFAAAEGLAMFNAETAAAIPVLTSALESKDAGVAGRAFAALTRLGERIASQARPPAEMLDSTDPRLRLAAVPAVRALPLNEGVPMLRRLLADPDADVRRAGVDAIEDVADKDQAIKLYKPLVNDADPVVRAKASGQLSRLQVPVTISYEVVLQAPPRAAADPTSSNVKAAFSKTTTAAMAAQKAAETVEVNAKDLAAAIAMNAHDDATLARVAELKTKVAEGSRQLAEAATKVEAETSDLSLIIAGAEAETAVGDLAEAQNDLDKVANRIRISGTKNPDLDYAYAELYDKMAAWVDHRLYVTELDPERLAKHRCTRLLKGDSGLALMVDGEAPVTRCRHWLLLAGDAYSRFVKTGTGPRVQRAKDRLTEITNELEELKQLPPR